MEFTDHIIHRFEEKYKEGNTPWVRTDIPEEIKEFARIVTAQGNHAAVLDVGCGDGWIAYFLAAQGFKVSGIDSAATAIQQAQAHNQYPDTLTFVIGNALDFSFDNNSFDAVCDRGLLHHIPEEEWHRYKAGLNRVLKPDGIFYLGVFSDDSVKKGFDPKKEGRMWNKAMDPSGYWTYDHFFTPETIQEFVGDEFELLWQRKDQSAGANGSVLIHSIFKKNK